MEIEDKAIINLDEYLKLKTKAEAFDQFKSCLEIRDLENNNYEIVINEQFFNMTIGGYLVPFPEHIDTLRIEK